MGQNRGRREVEERRGPPERLTQRGCGPKQHTVAGIEKGGMEGREAFIHSHRQTEKPHLHSGSELIGNSPDRMSAARRWPLGFHYLREVKILPDNC